MNPIHATIAAVAALATAGVAQRRGSRNATNSDAFRRWFGDSQVVDRAGNPLVVYHGTRGDFDTFQNPYLNENGAAGAWSMFSTDPDYSGEFASGRGGSILPVYLSIQKPLDLTGTEQVTKGEFLAILEKNGINASRIRIARYIHPRAKKSVFQFVNNSDVTVPLSGEMRRLGFDGIKMPDCIYSGETGRGYIQATTWIILDPTKAKSATGNRGTFDPEDARISYNRREP